MQFLSALLYHLIVRPISVLPFSVLYRVSDVLYLIMVYIIRYRGKVVTGNIRRCFPELKPVEQEAIIREFYRHFCDLLVESFKLFNISESALRERLVFENPEELNKYFREGRSVIIAGGHYNNWEALAVACQLYMDHQAVALYKPLASKWFDRKMQETRGRYGLILVPIQKTREWFENWQGKPTGIIFGMDQSPSKVARSHWMTFLGQETAVIFGTEKYSREFNQPVVYGGIHKTSRGHYSVRFETVTDTTTPMAHGEIVERTMKLLERDILTAPAYWLWSHRRWKHRKPEAAQVSA
ncbi:MAG: lysophospholipid acyltransferase family protein [Bacteroidota bacterium]